MELLSAWPLATVTPVAALRTGVVAPCGQKDAGRPEEQACEKLAIAFRPTRSCSNRITAQDGRIVA
jgi:hypothetical protein